MGNRTALQIDTWAYGLCHGAGGRVLSCLDGAWSSCRIRSMARNCRAIGGSGCHGQGRGGFGFSLEQLPEPGPERAVEDGATDLEQAIGTAGAMREVG